MTVRLSDESSEDVRFITDKANSFFAGVGADKVWPAAERLCAYLEAAQLSPGVAVEVGAGCSMPGIILARRGWDVTLTDLPWILPLVAANVEVNYPGGGGDIGGGPAGGPADGSGRRPAVASLRWGCRLDADALLRRPAAGATRDARRPDLVYGADIAYFEEDHPALLETLAHLQGARCVLAIQHRQGCQLSFAAAARARGWAVAEATVEKTLYGYPVTQRFCCSRCSVLVLTRSAAAEVVAGLVRLERAHGRTGSGWVWCR